MKKLLTVLAVTSAFFLLSGEGISAGANTTPQILTGILNKMEKAHLEMKSLKAELVQQKTNSQIGITDTETGSMIYKPAAGNMKGKIRIDYLKPSKDVISLVGENVTYYQPRINQVFKSSLAKASKGKLGGYAQLVGLDSSLKNLVGNYNIDIVKDETINGQMTTVLRLIPKNGSQFTSIDVWVNQLNSLPLQWKMVEKNGDFTIVTLKNMQVISNIPDTAFNVSIPGGTKVVDKI